MIFMLTSMTCPRYSAQPSDAKIVWWRNKTKQMLLLCQSYCCIFEFILFGVCWSFLNLNMYGFRQTWEFFSHFFKYIFLHSSLSSPSGASITQMVSLLIVFLKIWSFFFNFHLFSRCSSDWITFIKLPSNSLIFFLSTILYIAYPVNF